MSRRAVLLLSCALLACATLGACDKPASSAAAAPTPPAPLTLTGSVDLPSYTGDFDHFAADTKGGKLYLAGEDGHALEVFDLAHGQLDRSLDGLGTPHSPFLIPGVGELLVVVGDKPSPVLDTATLAVKRTLKLPAGADSMDYDRSTGHVWVVTGGKDVPQPDSHLIEVDPLTGKIFNDVHFDANHVEALVVEQAGPHIFINVTDKNYLAVVNKRSGKIEQRWTIKEAEQNAPVAYDEKTHRLFVVTRKPGKLVVLNSETGATVASFKAPERTDQVVWDEANRRVYVTGGEGYISVIQQDDPDHYRELARVPSAPGAKTSILVPSLHRLYVAASPGEGKVGGRILWYDVAAR